MEEELTVQVTISSALTTSSALLPGVLESKQRRL